MTSSGFSRYAPQQPQGTGSAERSRTLLDVIRDLDGASTELVERNKTIFFPGDPAERVYLIRRGAVRLSRVYESGEEITVALLRENSLFGVLSLLTGHRSDRFYHAVAFTRVEMVTAPAASVRAAIEADTSVGLRLLQGLSSRILQTETMIETLTHRDMSSRLRRPRRTWHHDRSAPIPSGHRRSDRLHTRHDHPSAGRLAPIRVGSD